MPGAAADQLASGPISQPGNASVSVLFADLRSYTTFRETRGASETFSTVNRYTEAVSRAVPITAAAWSSSRATV